MEAQINTKAPSSANKKGALIESWQSRLANELSAQYMLELKAFLKAEKSQGKVIYPPGELMFNALNQTPFEQVKVVIIGQDPYHGPNQAHGLSFSVPKGVPLPPSLRNIFQEISNDLQIPMSGSGDLTPWAKQGVLLLNATLSVEQAKAGSHQKKGWEQFTDAIIKKLNDEQTGLAFVLWGSYAQKKGAVIDAQKHLVLKSVHPSPLSAHRGFFNQHQFSQINQYLESQNKPPINWQL